MAPCNICNRRVLNHSYHLKCDNCLERVHLKCLPMVNKDDSLYINRNSNIWFCPVCLGNILPFNRIEDDDSYMEVIYDLQEANESIPFDVLLSNDNMFCQFELNEDFDLPLAESDPDIQYYNSQYNSSLKSCDYYLEDSFNKKISDIRIPSGCLSVIHANIRSTPKNLNKFNYI